MFFESIICQIKIQKTMDESNTVKQYFYRRKLTANANKIARNMLHSSVGSRPNTKQQQRKDGQAVGARSMHLVNQQKISVNLSALKSPTSPVANKHYRQHQSQQRKGSFSGHAANHRYIKFQQITQNQQKQRNSTIANLNVSLNSNIHVEQNSINTNKFGISNLSMQDYKRRANRQHVFAQLRKGSNLSIFLYKVQEKQRQFINHCDSQDYESAAQVISDLMNYSIDLKLKLSFTKSLKILGDFYIFVYKISQAIFYYNEAKQSSILLDNHTILIDSLIGIAKCCSKVNLERQAIIFLKKALQYAWLYQTKELEMNIYDQIGKRYYHMGEIERAKKYHQRYINADYQSNTSAHRMLSKQRTLKCHEINLQKRYNQISLLFLIHLKVPFKTLNELPPLIANNVNLNEEQLFLHDLVRRQINIQKKYQKAYGICQFQIQKILRGWVFSEQIQQPNLPEGDWTLPIKADKYKSIDFKLNQTLKKYTNKVFISKTQMRSKNVQFKQTLEQKIQRKINQPGLDSDWFQKMLSQIKRDHRNRLLNVRNAVRIRGYNSGNKPSLQIIKDIYHQFFEGSFEHESQSH